MDLSLISFLHSNLEFACVLRPLGLFIIRKVFYTNFIGKSGLFQWVEYAGTRIGFKHTSN